MRSFSSTGGFLNYPVLFLLHSVLCYKSCNGASFSLKKNPLERSTPGAAARITTHLQYQACLGNKQAHCVTMLSYGLLP